MSLRCMVCGADPSRQPVAIYRLNDKGRPGVFACRAHYAKAKAEHFPDDDPDAPASPDQDPEPVDLGPWTGGITPVGGRLQ